MSPRMPRKKTPAKTPAAKSNAAKTQPNKGVAKKAASRIKRDVRKEAAVKHNQTREVRAALNAEPGRKYKWGLTSKDKRKMLRSDEYKGITFVQAQEIIKDDADRRRQQYYSEKTEAERRWMEGEDIKMPGKGNPLDMIDDIIF